MTLLDRIRRIAVTGPCVRDHTGPYAVQEDSEGWPILVHPCGCVEGYEAEYASRLHYGRGAYFDPCDLPDGPEWTPPPADHPDDSARTGSHQLDTMRVSIEHR